MSEQERKQSTVAEVLVKCLENEGVKYVFGIPGEENLDMMNALEKSDIRVENTGNVKEFIRLRLVSYYVDSNGDIVGTVSSQYPALTLKNGWITGANHTYYYPYSVEPGEATGILCEPFTLGQKLLANGKTVYQVIELIAEAVQAEPSNAAQEVWGVTVENGVVTPAQ